MRILSNVNILGTLDLDNVQNAAADTDRFLVQDANGVVKFRTGAEVASDIGASVGFVSTVKHEVKLGEAIATGQAVYVTSADGTNMIVSKASNATDATSSKTLGLIQTGGIANDIRYVITEGLLAGLNTSTAVAGDPVWLGTNGNLLFGTANKPVAPAHMVFIGIVTRVQTNNGEIFVKVQNGFELEELHNVLITGTPVDKAVIQYDTASGLWKNSALGGVTGSGANGQVAFFTGATTQSGSNNLFWNNTNGYLGIGTNTPSERLHVLTSAISTAIFEHTGVNGAIDVRNTGTLASNRTSQVRLSNGSTFFGANDRSWQIINLGTSATASVFTLQYFDGTNYTRPFTITDTGRLLLGSTSDNGLRFQVTGDGFFSGRLGLGSTSLTNTILRVGNNITGAASHFSVFASQSVQSDVSNASIFTTEISTQATAFTLNTLRHYRATQGTFGASSIVTNQYGFFAESTLTGATNNYGFYGDIASGTGRWNLYMNGTAANYLAGSLGIGVVSPSMPLDIAGTSVFGIRYNRTDGAAGDARIILQSGTASTNIHQYGQSHATLASIFRLSSSGGIEFLTSGVAAARFSTAQNLTLGGTVSSDTGERLQVNGTMKVTGASTFGGASTFNGAMTLALNQNAGSIFRVQNTTSGTSSYSELIVQSDASSGSGSIGKVSSAYTPYKLLTAGSTYIYNGTAGNLAILNDFASGSIVMAAGAASTAQLTLNASGNLGLGVTPSAWTSTRAIQVGLSGSIANRSGGNGFYMSSNLYFSADPSNTAANGVYINSDFATTYLQANGAHRWFNAPSGTAGNAITFTQAMTLHSTGNLAIGTGAGADAGFRLDVNGTMRVSGASTFSSSVTAGGRFASSGTGFNSASSAEVSLTNTTASTGRQFVLNSGNAGFFQIADVTAGGATRFYMNASGEIGIGNSNPTSTVHITGTFKAFSNSINLEHASGILYHYGGTSNYYQYPNGANYFISNRTSTGSLILSTQDTARLTIDSTGAATFSSSVTAGGANGFTIGAVAGVARITHGTEAANTFSFTTSSNAAATIYAGAFIPQSGTVPVNGMYLGAANQINFATNTTNRLSISSTGNLTFVGPFISLNANGYIRTDNVGVLTLQSGSNGFVVRNVGNSADFLSIASTGAATFSSSVTAANLTLTDAGGGIINNNTGNLFFQKPTSGGFIFRNGSPSFTEYMRLTATGNLLLGTTSASTNGLLQINGDLGFQGSRTVRIASNSDGETLTYLGTRIAISNTNSFTYGYADGALIASVANSDNISLIDSGRYSGATIARFKVSNTTSGDVSFSLIRGTDTTFFASTLGRVGIGTSSPTAKLDVFGTGLQLGSTPYYYNTRIINNNNSGLLFGGDNSSSIGFIAGINEIAFVTYGVGGWSEKARLSGEGNLGIGTTSINAAAKLQVDSTTGGFLPPRMTAAQRAAISTPPIGLVVYQTDGTEGLYIYTNANGWKSLAIVN